jgi:hypothetical protein
MVGFAGEVDAINGGDNTYGLTSRQLVEFYGRVQGFWRAAAPRQLLTTGGLMQLDWASGIDWRPIFNLPDNDIVALHVYTDGEANSTIPQVARFSREIGKPWIIEEFGYPASLPDDERAWRFEAMYERAEANGAAGVGLWNVGSQTADTYDVGPQFPLTFRVVRDHAPEAGG